MLLTASEISDPISIGNALPKYSFSELHQKSLEAYEASPTATAINHYLRTGQRYWGPHEPEYAKPQEEAIKQHLPRIKAVMNAIDPVGKSLVLHRGVEDPDSMNDDREVFGPIGSQVGQTFHDKGFMSTSTDPKVANMYGSTHLVLHTHPNAKALDMKKHGTIPENHEVLLNHGSRWNVASDEISPHNGLRTIHLHQQDPREVD